MYPHVAIATLCALSLTALPTQVHLDVDFDSGSHTGITLDGTASVVADPVSGNRLELDGDGEAAIDTPSESSLRLSFEVEISSTTGELLMGGEERDPQHGFPGMAKINGTTVSLEGTTDTISLSTSTTYTVELSWTWVSSTRIRIDSLRVHGGSLDETLFSTTEADGVQGADIRVWQDGGKSWIDDVLVESGV